jgi:hypothetical protein
MRKYHVLFFVGTDLRADATVEAANDLIALALALDECQQGDWIEHELMRIEIRGAK